MSYISVCGDCVTEKVIEKSRFITTSRHIKSEEEAKNFVAEISNKYSDATHNCYAYVCDSLGNFLRFSDNGEPQGTAGMPMLEVIKNKKIFEVGVVVTRYFGGIKLGAGGLVRAYSSCAAENLETAQKVLYDICIEQEVIIDYSFVDSAIRFFNENNATINGTNYSNEVIFNISVKKSEIENFNAALTNRLNGRVKIKKLCEKYFPFKI